MHLLPALAAIPFCLSAQAPEQAHLDQLARFKGNKVLLLGTWSVVERKAWERLVAEEGLFEQDLALVDSASWAGNPMGYGDPAGFEAWLRGRYGLGASRWVLLDNANRAMAFDITTPKAPELAAQLESNGLSSPLRQLRSFLATHPDHLDARADLLKELRRRSLKVAKGDGKSDLGAEADLIAWAPFASAVDTAFKTDWQGLVLPFFRVEQDQPERRSPLMKAIFTRHIRAVEAALRENPTRESLWNLWGWMARSLGDRPWQKFLTNLDPFLYPGGPTCPAPNVAVWLTKEAMAAGDWEWVAELTAMSQGLSAIPVEVASNWMPGLFLRQTTYQSLKGFPEESSYAPRLEALLRLKRQDEAQRVFEDLLLSRGVGSALVAAEAARRAGENGLAREWAMGRLPQPVAFSHPVRWGRPQLVVRANWDDPYLRRLSDLSQDLKPVLETRFLGIGTSESLGWNGEEHRWAMLDGRGRVLVQGKALPKVEILQTALDKMELKSRADLAREFLRRHPGHPEASRVLAIESGQEAARQMSGDDKGPKLDPEADAKLWSECAQAWSAYYKDADAWKAPETLEGGFDGWVSSAKRSPLMRDIAVRALPKLEAALEREPMSRFLWNTWLFLRDIEGESRAFAVLLARLEPDPMTAPGTFPPASVMNTWLEDCQQTGRWGEAAKLLRQPWERDLARIDTEQNVKQNAKPDPRAWNTGHMLVKALLQDGRASEADEVVNAWAERSGTFTELEPLSQLAKQLGHETLAGKWEKLNKTPR
jgi:hypothetical protein